MDTNIKNIELEKVSVLDWLGYVIEHIPEDEISHYPESRSVSIIPAYDALFKDGKQSQYSLDGWNPHEDRNCWDEIWDALSYEQEKSYSDNLWLLLGANGMDTLHHNQMLFHTAKPELCWEALIKTLQEIK